MLFAVYSSEAELGPHLNHQQHKHTLKPAGEVADELPVLVPTLDIERREYVNRTVTGIKILPESHFSQTLNHKNLKTFSKSLFAMIGK